LPQHEFTVPVAPKKNQDDSNEDYPFHFVAYIPSSNKIYEMDGFNHSPLKVGEYTNKETWYDGVVDVLRERMAQCEDSLYFSLMAVKESEETILKREREELRGLMEGKSLEEKQVFRDRAKDLAERMERLLKDGVYNLVRLFILLSMKLTTRV
jgi:hypothetical protein